MRQHRCGTLDVVGHCEEFDPVLVHRARMEEKNFVDKMKVHDVVPRSDAAKNGCRVIRTRWAMANKGSDDKPSDTRKVGRRGVSCRGRDKHEYFSETPDLALVKAVIAYVARWAGRSDTVVAVFDVRWAYIYAEEK